MSTPIGGWSFFSASRPAAAVAAVLVLSGCSPIDPEPPELAGCSAGDAPCEVPVVGVSSKESEAGDTDCPIGEADSLCFQCLSDRCCSPLSACTGNQDCLNLFNCAAPCTDKSCLGTCESQFPSAVSVYESLSRCEPANCPVCAELGIGDPCQSQNACNVGLSCTTGYCTHACSNSAGCVGLGAGGGNQAGLENACIHLSTGSTICVPSCMSDSDCVNFAGSFCEMTASVDGLAVKACLVP